MDIDGISTLEERFSALPAGAKVTLSIKHDPHGTREVLEPLKGLRRDETLEAQLFAYLGRIGAESGLYQVQLRESGRVMCTHDVPVKLFRPVEAPVLPATPAATPAATPGTAPAATPEVDPEIDFFRKLYRQTVRDAMASRFNPPAPAEVEYEDDEEEPSRAGFVNVLETAMASPVFGPALARLTEAMAEIVQGQARVMDAKSRLYEARATRNGAAPKPPPSRSPARVVGLRPVRLAPTPTTGGPGEGSA